MSGLQNRVCPTGSLFRNDTRGLFTGNRGILHDPATKTLTGRRWTTKAWICCALAYKNRTRDVWGRNGPNGRTGWTELFFADEVTALAAGHRPCFTCRREDAERFRVAFAKGQGVAGMSAVQMDQLLHAQRRLSMRQEPQHLSAMDLGELPDGTIIEAGTDFYALWKGHARLWHFSGYGPPRNLCEITGERMRLVTPPAIVSAIQNGYVPVWREHST